MAIRQAAEERVLATYCDHTKRSGELFERAGHLLEGGTIRTSVSLVADLEPAA